MISRRNKKLRSYFFGKCAETLTVIYLIAKCYRIEERRYKTKLGEIDIIAKRRNQLVFVEVKARKKIAQSEEVLTMAQRIRITNAASMYLSKRPKLSSCKKRFDLVIISPNHGLKHIQNAW